MLNITKHTTSAQDDHYVNCIDHNAVKVKMPWKEEDKWVHYDDRKNQFKVSFVMYADFESIFNLHIILILCV